MDARNDPDRFFTRPAPEPRFAFRGILGEALYFAEFEAAVAYYERVLGPPGYAEGSGTCGWRIGATWLTLLRGADGAPRNVEVQLVVETPAEAERLQAAFVSAGGTGSPPADAVMYQPVRSCPVTDPFGTALLITAPRPTADPAGAGGGRSAAGRIVHVNLPALDLARSREFYGTVFGWTFTPNTDGYVLFHDGGGVDGALTTGAKPAADGVLLFLQVDDIPDAVTRIEAAGGSLLQGKRPVGGPGFYAIFVDPAGNRIGLFSDT